jgi:hypothetical protein
VPTVPKTAEMAPVMGSTGPWSLSFVVDLYLAKLVS